MPRTRVFVSSVVEGFAEYRQAARGGIEQAGGDAVLVNEDFPAQANSSRNTCLDAIDSCDVFLLILGARGGWKTPSGRLVVEEEFEHARARKLPVLLFLEDVPRDAEGQRFAKSLSDYVDGTFRVKFTGVTELRDQVERLLRTITDTRNNGSMDHDPIEAHLQKPHRFSDQTCLRFAIAPERVEEVFDPLDLASPEFTDRMMEIGHSRDVRLFRLPVCQGTTPTGAKLAHHRAEPGRYPTLSQCCLGRHSLIIFLTPTARPRGDFLGMASQREPTPSQANVPQSYGRVKGPGGQQIPRHA